MAFNSLLYIFKNHITRFLQLSLIVISFSCQNKSLKESEDYISIDIDTIIKNTSINFSDIFSNFHIIPLESNEECQFEFLSDIKIIDSIIYVYDRFKTKSVYLFSYNGTFLSKVYNIGRGPGEYINPTDFVIDSNSGTILVYDWASKKLNEYDKQGNCIKTVTFTNRFMSFILDNDQIFTYIPYPENPENPDDNLLKIFDRKANLISSHLNYQSVLKGPKILEFQFGGYFFKAKNDIKFFPIYNNTVYSITNDSIHPFLVLNSNEYKLTQKDLNNIDLDKPIDRINAIQRTNKFLKVHQYSENCEIAYFIIDIGFNQYHTFYNFRTKKVKCTIRFNDDITLIFPNFSSLRENQFITYLHPTRIAKFLELINSDKIKVSEKQKKSLENVTNFSNPIIIIYDLK